MLSTRSRRLALAVALGTFLYFVYLLTYSGIYTTGDEEALIDATAGIAVRSGEDRLLLSQTFYLRGLMTSDVEPAQPLLAAPLYWVGYQLDQVGTIHVLYLFNLLVTTLTAIVIFYYALHLGYNENLAIFAALLFGLTTIVWPYARTFFREPLTMLTLTAAAYFMHRWRDAFTQHHQRGLWLWGALTALAGVSAVLTKEAALIALPVLIFFNVPDWSTLSQRKREITWIGIGLAVFSTLFVIALLIYRQQIGALAERYDLLMRFNAFLIGLPAAWYATLGYLFSPARGTFWYSPILLLAVGSPLLLPRSKWREAWLPLVMLLVFAFVYAAIRGDQWFGGKSWGGRYMVPIVPIVMLGTLPLIQKIVSGKRIPAKIVLISMALFGLAIQIGATIVPMDAFFAYQTDITGHAPWSDTIVWSIQWSQALGTLLYLPTYLDTHTADILWWIPEANTLSVVAIITGGLLAVASLWLIRFYRQNWHITAALLGSAALMAGISLFALFRAYDDPRYAASDEGLIMLREKLAQEAGSDDAIMLATPKYVPYFLNYYKGEAVWYSLPVSPGERASCEQEPLVTSNNPQDLIDPDVQGLYSRFIQHKKSIWLVVDYGPMQACAVRPVERFFAQKMYLIQSKDFTPTVRLVEYNPLTVSVFPPAERTQVHFGDQIKLIGYDLAGDPVNGLDNLQAGDRIGVSLSWLAKAPIDVDYTIVTFLIMPDGSVAGQQDRGQFDLFPPTYEWEAGNAFRTNFGFILPSPLPLGEYQLWVAVYSRPTPEQLERLRVIAPDNTDLGDYFILTSLTVD